MICKGLTDFHVLETKHAVGIIRGIELLSDRWVLPLLNRILDNETFYVDFFLLSDTMASGPFNGKGA